MEMTRTIELDAGIDEVWRFLADPEELAGWVGEEVRGTVVDRDAVGRRLTWCWAPDGVESTVELTVTADGDRTYVTVVERTAGPAPVCSRARWDGALLDLELRALSWPKALART
jgi:hypothetical protein